ncbi:TolC family protein [Putridiphycobacter roseus]|uniref:TolC family protein n=1 Tax=Putridiphycobacter roseus TaxID=2219161 RepID=A0A2W1NKL4_9FLAO|nr:TolC family protein [Putridiphycobacter roseus]PZE16202.1 TolC family protein [Putridiphycobacter roseus]
MKKNKLIKHFAIPCLLFLTACGIPKLQEKNSNAIVPEQYTQLSDTNSIAKLKWHEFFSDPYLVALIDTALKNNQELNMILQEINMSQNEISAKKGELLPFLNLGGGAAVDKVPRYTRDGAVEANVDIEPGKEFPEPLPDFNIQFNASWEVDIWRKLRNSRDAAVARYLSSVEGKNFMVTKMVAEIANAYYELLSLDAQMGIIQDYILIQKNGLKTVKIQKQNGEATELAVRKFEAEVLNTQSIQYDIQQAIIEMENKLNFLLGRYPKKVERNPQTFLANIPTQLSAGVPTQLMSYRPDIKAAELRLTAARLNVKVAKAQFYPRLDISAGLGLGAFNPVYLVKSPESMLFSLAGDAVAPLINRKAIKAAYLNANAKQIQTVFDYEKTLLNAYLEVYNQVSNIDNLEKSYALKNNEVSALSDGIAIALDLFKSARADYMEVLLTQRDALDAQLELVEYKKERFVAMINLYQSLGGGWK